jgi:hypothetical protein
MGDFLVAVDQKPQKTARNLAYLYTHPLAEKAPPGARQKPADYTDPACAKGWLPGGETLPPQSTNVT